jgi:hypothetical protein
MKEFEDVLIIQFGETVVDNMKIWGLNWPLSLSVTKGGTLNKGWGTSSEGMGTLNERGGTPNVG